MNIIYAITYLISYYVFVDLFTSFSGWKKDKKLPELERSNKVVIGRSEKGLVYHDFNKYTHMIIAGSIGYGKTNFIKTLISQLDGEIVLIDLKGGFDYDHKETASNITEARYELERVINKMRKLRKDHIYVIIDEGGELLPPDHFTKKEASDYLECLTHISEIGRLGRAFKTHLIYATQYPTADILPRQVKQCCETRLCFRLPTEIASRVVLDEPGAEELPSGVRGLGLYKRDTKFMFKAYQFIERDGWCEKIRKKENKGTEDYFIIE